MGQWAREVINKYLLQPSVRWDPEDDVCGHISIEEPLSFGGDGPSWWSF